MIGRIKQKFAGILNTGIIEILGSGVLVKVIGFLSSIILVRIVTKEEYGVFTTAWNAYSIAMLATGFGASYALLQIGCENSHDSKKKENLYQYGLNCGLIANIVLGIVVFLLGVYYPFPIADAAALMQMMCILPLVQYGVEYQTMYFRVEKKNRQYGIANSINVALVLFFSIVGASFVRERGFIVGRYVAYSLLLIIGIWVWKVPFHLKKVQLSKDEKRDFWHVAIISMINGGISQLLYLVDVFILGIVLPDKGVIASYKVATILPTALSFIPTAVVTYIFPYFTERRNDRKWCLKAYGKVTGIMALANGTICAALYMCAPLVIELMYGAEYLDAVLPFRILVVNYFFSGTFRAIAGNLLVTQRKLGFNTFVAILSGILNIVADVILIKNFGSVGAAIATLFIVMICSAMNTSYLIYTFQKRRENK